MRHVAKPLAVAVALAFACAGCGLSSSRKIPIPGVEYTGPPYDDAIEIAAANALGPVTPMEGPPRFEPIRLGAFRNLPTQDAAARARAARALVETLERWQFQGIDSLPIALAALRIDPSSALAYAHAGRMTAKRGEVARTRAFATQGLRLDAKIAPLWALLSDCDDHDGREAEARIELQQALALHPEHIEHAFEKLVALETRAGHFARADSIASNSPEALRPMLHDYVIGQEARARGDHAAASSALHRAAAQPMASLSVVMEWGRAELDAGDFAMADSAFRRAARLSPHTAAAWLGLGTAQRGHNSLDAACASFARAVELAPRDSLAQFDLAGASLAAAERAGASARGTRLRRDAEAAFTACIAADYRVPECSLRRGELRLLRGDAQAAAADARPFMTDAHYGLQARRIVGRAALVEHRPREVVECLGPVEDALDADALEWLGRAYLDLHRPRDAVRVLRRAHDMSPEDRSGAVNLGIALSESGDLAGAEAVLRPLEQRFPNDPDVLRNLAAVLQRRGRRAEAARLLERERALRAH